MPLAERFHGTRVFKGPAKARPISTDDYSIVGALMVAPNADADLFPLNKAVTMFTNDATMKAAAGAGGNVDAIFDAIDDQADEEFGAAEIQVVRVDPGANTAATMTAMVGSGSTLTGCHAFKVPPRKAKIYIAPGFTDQSPSGLANPVVTELLTIAARHRGIVVADAPATSKEAAETWRGLFANQKRLYAISPQVMVDVAGTPTAQPASGRVAGLFVRKDKQEGGPHVSPSNQVIGGSLGPSRPIAYYDGEPDSEANWLNQRSINTIIDNTTLWGSETCASDPLYRFVNVVRTEDAIDSAVAKAFRWAMDANLNVPLATAIVQSLDAFLSDAAVRGWIIQGRVSFDVDANSSANMVSGQLVIDYDREPYAPLTDLQFRASRNPDYYDLVAEGIQRAVEQINQKRRRLIYGVNLGL